MLVFSPFVLYAKVIQTQQITDILQEVTPDTIVFFDIDDTLLNTKILLGNSSWWKYFTEKVRASNYNVKNQSEVLALIRKILTEVPVVPIDPCSVEIIKSLQDKGIITLGLTARFLRAEYLDTMDDLSYKQLKSFGVDFTKNSLSNQSGKTLNFFSHGVIFTDHNPKGPYLKEFLSHMNIHPKKIIFVDDSENQMKSVEEAVEGLGIHFIGFRYGALDHYHRSFNPLIANIQLEAFLNENKILSDEEAMHLVKANPCLDPHYFLDKLIQQWKD